MIIDFTGKIETEHQGLMIGNGSIGALIFGTDNLTLSLDKIDLWDNRLPKEHFDKNFNYPYMIKASKTDYAKMRKLFDNCYNHPYPTKINAGSLIFSNEVFNDDKFLLDTKTASFSYNSKASFVKGYIDYVLDVLVLQCSNNLEIGYKSANYLTRQENERGLNYKPYRIIKNERFTVYEQKTHGKNKFGVVLYEINQGETKDVYVTIYKNNNLRRAKSLLINYSKNKDSNYAQHQRKWEEYYNTSSIITCDSKVNELYEKGRYFFGCNSTKKYPMTLQGVWTQNDGNPPPWKSDLHNDINVQMTYDSYLRTGNYCEGLVLLNYLNKNKRAFGKFAKNFMKTDGLLIPGVMSQNCIQLGGWPQYALNPSVSIWALKPFNDYYQHTKDEKFLRKIAFPFFYKTEKCIFSILHLNKNGNYELEIHSSPEYFEDDVKSLFNSQTNFELINLRFLYETLIEYCDFLRKDATHYKEVYARLADYYRDENGILKISADQKYDMSHRHFSHMLMYKNFEIISPFNNEETIYKDVKNLEQYGFKRWVGFSYVEMAGLYAYIRKGEEAYKYLKIFEDGFIYPNGFHMNFDYKNLGYSDWTGHVLTLEANIGYVRTLCDMLIQNVKGVITVFPAIPKEFKTQGVSFQNLRLYINSSVSGEYKNDCEKFYIKFAKPTTVQLYNNFANNPLLKIDGVDVNYNSKIGDIIKIECRESIKYETYNDREFRN